jgi:hypothetical protein
MRDVPRIAIESIGRVVHPVKTRTAVKMRRNADFIPFSYTRYVPYGSPQFLKFFDRRDTGRP